jgi:2,4-dienoyl-CoA reductase (NADPH2)
MTPPRRRRHRVVTDAVHAAGGKIACRSCTPGATPTTPAPSWPRPHPGPDLAVHPARADGRQVERRSSDFVRCAALRSEAGYDGVEIMGSEGYLINQFLVTPHQPAHGRVGRRLCQPHALPGGDRARTREAVGPDFIIIYRLSMLDLVEGGSSWDEVVQLAQASRRRRDASSTPASAGTRRASRPSPPACRAPPSPG